MTGTPIPAGDSASSQVVVSITDLRKTYKDFWGRSHAHALRGISLEIQRGEVFGLLGPNGSGKSTTMKILMGLLHPTSGTVSVLGRPPRDVRAKTAIGYMPEESYLYEYLTAEESLHFYARLFNMPRSARIRRVDDLLTLVDLQEVRHRAVGEYSKGMARRVTLAQALLNEPELLLLDEPTAGLDPIGCREVKDLIRRLAADGTTVLVTSHLLADMGDVCSRVAIMNHGTIAAMGALSDLVSRDDRCELSLPALPPERLDAVLAELRRIAGTNDVSVRSGTEKLEDVFLRVVRGDGPPAPEESPPTCAE